MEYQYLLSTVMPLEKLSQGEVQLYLLNPIPGIYHEMSD